MELKGILPNCSYFLVKLPDNGYDFNQQKFSEMFPAGPQKYEKREAIYFNEYYRILFKQTIFILRTYRQIWRNCYCFFALQSTVLSTFELSVEREDLGRRTESMTLLWDISMLRKTQGNLFDPEAEIA